jgi:hypothetical protein
MATVDVSNGINAGTHPSRAIRKEPYKVEFDLNLATATTTKGSALASADVLQVIDIPAKTMVWAAGLEVITPNDGTSTGDMTSIPAAYAPLIVSADDTIDVVIGPTDGSADPTSGVWRVFAVMQDLSDDLGPDEVDRDQLA